jgi:hypothetical protein
MSVWGTTWDADGDNHANNCSRWSPPVKTGPGAWTSALDGSRPCDCGQPGSPITYLGSHILPSQDSERSGIVSLALIPSHITRDGRDDQPDDEQPWPYLRLSVGEEDAVLDEQLARSMHEALGEWLKERGAGAAEPGQADSGSATIAP